jgi:hypothetical protein
VGWRRVFGRPGRALGARDVAVVGIDRLRRDQREIDARLRAAVVDAAVLERAVRDQRRLLGEAAAQIRDATARARGAAERAAADRDGLAAAGYRQAVDGFGSQLAVVEGTRAQLDRLAGGAATNLDRTRTLLRESAASLDRALRAEVELLGRLERLDRRQAIARIRREGGGAGSG